LSALEILRRDLVAQEKLLGYIVESIERLRKKPIAKSIMLRLISLYGFVLDLHKVVKIMGTNPRIVPTKTVAPSFTIEQANSLIKTYNGIIKDMKDHLRKKDAYIDSFQEMGMLKEATLNEVAKTLFIMGLNIMQIVTYMVRWIE